MHALTVLCDKLEQRGLCRAGPGSTCTPLLALAHASTGPMTVHMAGGFAGLLCGGIT